VEIQARATSLRAIVRELNERSIPTARGQRHRWRGCNTQRDRARWHHPRPCREGPTEPGKRGVHAARHIGQKSKLSGYLAM